MNYNERATRKKKKSLSSKLAKHQRKLSVSLFKGTLVAILLLIVVGIGVGFGALKGILDNLPDVTTDNLIPQGYQTVLYDQSGKEVTTLNDYDSNRIYKTYDEIPEQLRNAFIAIEDERFWTHNGIDVRGIGGAAIQFLSGGRARGASTITQQLIKNQIFNVGLNETTMFQTVQRKIQEQYLAIQIEKSLSKETILEYYLNTIYLGQGAYGVQAASERYFGKDKMAELTISECGVLAAITQNPSKYDPIALPDENSKRRKDVLDKMLELEFISEPEYDRAMSDDVYTRIREHYESAKESTTYNSYYVDAVINDLKTRLINKLGYTESQAYNAIYSGGLSVYICQDAGLQKIADDIVADDSNYPNTTSVALEYLLSLSVPDPEAEGGVTEKNYDTNNLIRYYKELTGNKKYNQIYKSEELAVQAAETFKEAMLEETGGKFLADSLKTAIQPQTSYVLMDHHTGEVKAIVGGRGPKTSNRSLNRATMSTRQPGSTFKVLAAFLPAIDGGGKSLATSYLDEPYAFRNGIKVRNWYGKYRGWATIREAITNSMNIIAVKTITDITPELGYEYLIKMGFTTLVDSYTNANGDIISDINQSLALGGLTNGVTNMEITAAYASIANGGVYTEPILFTKVLDHNGDILLDNKPETHKAMEPTTAWLITSALKDVVTKGTGTKARLKSNMPVAGKTGTTSSDYDFWFCGFTPYYTASIWMGYDSNTSFNNSVSYHKMLWAKIMNEVIDYEQQSTSATFPKPDGITSCTVCQKSGMLPTEDCPRITEYFAKSGIPKKPCNGSGHRVIKICKDSKLIATEYCPETFETTYEIGEDGRIKLSGDYGITPGKDYLTKTCALHTEPEGYTITTSAGKGGTITPTQVVEKGATVTIIITPNDGYKIKDVIVDDESRGALKKFTFKNVANDHTISAKFEKDKDSKPKPEPEPEPQPEPEPEPQPEPQPEPEPQPVEEFPSALFDYITNLFRGFMSITAD